MKLTIAGPSSKRELEQTLFYFLADSIFILVAVCGVRGGCVILPEELTFALVNLLEDRVDLPRAVAILDVFSITIDVFTAAVL